MQTEARQRRAGRVGVGDLRAGNRCRAQRARIGAAAERRARARQRLQLRRVAGRTGARDPRRAFRRAARREPVPVARAGGRRVAAVRGHVPERRLAVERRSHACVGRRAERCRGRVVHGRSPRPLRRRRRRAVRRLPASAPHGPVRPTLLPGVPGNAVDRSAGTPARLGALEYGHPALEVFRAPRSGDFAAARFYGYRAVTASPGLAGPGAIRRWGTGAARAEERQRPRADVDVVDRHLLERSRGPPGVPAVDAPAAALPRGLQRAGAVAHGRGGRRRAGHVEGRARAVEPGRPDAVRAAGGARRRGAGSAGADRAGFLRDPGAGAGRRAGGRGGEQRRPGRVGHDAAGSEGGRGRGDGPSRRPCRRTARRLRRPTRRRKARSGSGGT